VDAQRVCCYIDFAFVERGMSPLLWLVNAPDQGEIGGKSILTGGKNGKDYS